MSEQWLGLHNPERHFVTFEGGACHCDECDVALCLPNHLCRCCLAAEVQALRRHVQRFQARLGRPR